MFFSKLHTMQNTKLVNKFIPIKIHVDFLSHNACILKMQKSEGLILHRLILVMKKSLHKLNQLVKSCSSTAAYNS